MDERLLNDQIIGQIREAFNSLKEPVQILFFGKKTDCEYCEDTLKLVQEVIQLSDLLSLRVHDLEQEAQLAAHYRVDKAPGLVLLGGPTAHEAGTVAESQDYGVRFAGIPSGYEFSSFIQGLLMVSGRDSGLSQATRLFLKQLSQPVLLQVFVTPT